VNLIIALNVRHGLPFSLPSPARMRREFHVPTPVGLVSVCLRTALGPNYVNATRILLAALTATFI
jgi:hypothetical protein